MAKAKGVKVPVSQAALVARLNRALAKDGRVLRAARGARAQLELGDYFIVDTGSRGVTSKFVDLEETARGMGCLRDYETLAEE